MTLTREACRTAAQACFRNAESLLEDARALFAQDKHPRAMSLCILGHEEMAKAFLYLLAALDLVPDLRSALVRANWHDPSRDHQFKQLLGDTAAVAHYFINTFSSTDASLGYPVREVIRHTADWLESTGAVRGGEARKSYVAGRIAQKRQFEPEAGTLPQGMEGSREDMKWRGLYVDVDREGVVTTPERVSQSAAHVVLADLTVSLRDVRPIRQALDSDEEWSGLEQHFATSAADPF